MGGPVSLYLRVAGSAHHPHLSLAAHFPLPHITRQEVHGSLTIVLVFVVSGVEGLELHFYMNREAAWCCASPEQTSNKEGWVQGDLSLALTLCSGLSPGQRQHLMLPFYGSKTLKCFKNKIKQNFPLNGISNLSLREEGQGWM